MKAAAALTLLAAASGAFLQHPTSPQKEAAEHAAALKALSAAKEATKFLEAVPKPKPVIAKAKDAAKPQTKPVIAKAESAAKPETNSKPLVAPPTPTAKPVMFKPSEEAILKAAAKQAPADAAKDAKIKQLEAEISGLEAANKNIHGEIQNLEAKKTIAGEVTLDLAKAAKQEDQLKHVAKPKPAMPHAQPVMSKPKPAAKRVLPKLKHQPAPVRRSNPVKHKPAPVRRSNPVKHKPAPVRRSNPVKRGPTPVRRSNPVKRRPTPVMRHPNPAMRRPQPAAKRVLSKLNRRPMPPRRSNPVRRGPVPVHRSNRPKPAAKPFRSMHMRKLQAQGKLKPRQIPHRQMSIIPQLQNKIASAVKRAVRLNKNQSPGAVASVVKRAAIGAGASPVMAQQLAAKAVQSMRQHGRVLL